MVALALCGLFVFKGVFSAPPPVETTLAKTGFDTERAIARLARILGDERPHPVDTPANDAVRERLLVEITALGQTPVVRDDFACRGARRWAGMSCARVRNVMFRMGPATGKAALVASHYDSVPAGPGAADDGAGVSSALEIAAQLSKTTLSKPVIFLFTDGEEFGLLGAASFVRKDPWAKDVAFALNMEARGTGGPAIMFQTSSPNGRDIAALTHNGMRGQASVVANSMAADIYRTLPNDTDATEFVAMGWDVVNFAFIAPLARYHTPNDSLAYLQHESVGQMGAAGLQAIEGYLAAPETGQNAGQQAVEHDVIYSDVFGRFVVVLPAIAGLVFVVLGAIAALGLFVKSGGGRSWRALVAPPLAVTSGGGLAFGLLWVVGQVQPELAWWTATPAAAKTLTYGSALFGAVIGLWLCKGVMPSRAIAGAWLWLCSLFIGLWFVSPGAMILAAPAAGVFTVVALMAWFVEAVRKHPVWFLVPALVLLAFVLPALEFAEAGLGFGLGAGFAGIAALMAVITWSALGGVNDTRWTGVAAVLSIAALGAVWASLAPAHNRDLPRPLNIQHWHGPEHNHWVLSPAGKSAPDAMNQVTPFVLGEVYGADGQRMQSGGPVTSPQIAAPQARLISQVALPDGKRRMVVQITAQEADEVTVAIPDAAQVTEVAGGANGAGGRYELDAEGGKTLRCVGRACTVWDIEVVANAAPTDWMLQSFGRGLPPEGEPLKKARPDWANQLRTGDVRVASRAVRL
jgi:Peptidase family M28